MKEEGDGQFPARPFADFLSQVALAEELGAFTTNGDQPFLLHLQPVHKLVRAADNVVRAQVVGAYFAEAWHARGRRSGKHQDAFFP